MLVAIPGLEVGGGARGEALALFAKMGAGKPKKDKKAKFEPRFDGPSMNV